MEYSEERQPPDVITSDTDNATTIQPKEAAPHKRKKFRRFRAYNTNMWNGPRRENTEQFRRQDNLHRYDSLSSSLCLNDYQRSRGRRILDDLDVRKMGKSVDVIIFGICVLVANADVQDGTRHYPHSNSSGDEKFNDVSESIGLNRQEQLSIIETVRSKTNL